MADTDESEPGSGGRKPSGRPSKFKPEFIEQARKLCLLGATEREVADFFEVEETTVQRWKQQNEAFCGALKAGKDPADDRVEQSLYRRAVGYSYDAVKIMQYEGEPVIVPYVEHVPPDTTACIFWLKNRRREQWRDKVEVTGEITHTVSEALEAARKRASRRPVEQTAH